MEHLALGLFVLLIGVLGIGGGKMWGTSAIKVVQAELLERCAVCLEERKEKESELEKELNEEIRPRLMFGNLLMLSSARKPVFQNQGCNKSGMRYLLISRSNE